MNHHKLNIVDPSGTKSSPNNGSSFTNPMTITDGTLDVAKA